MKNLLLNPKAKGITLLFLFIFCIGNAQTNYYSSGNNAPNVLSSWWSNTNGTGTNPANFTTANVIYNIQNGHTMTTTNTWTVSGTNSQIRILTGGTLVASNVVTAISMNVASGGTYRHNQNGGSIPTATWNAASTCAVTGVTTIVPTVATFNQSFGNFTWNCPSQTADLSLVGELLTVNGNLTVTATNTGSLRLSNSGVTETLNIGGNYIQTGGEFYISGSGNNTWTVNLAGNFSMTGGVFDMNGATGTSILNVSGNFTHTGGTITETGSSTSSAIIFNSGITQNYTSGGTVSNVVAFTVASPTTLQMGTGASPAIITGGGAFTIASGATLGVTSPGGITITSAGAVGNIQSTGTRTYSAGADYIYNGTSAQVTGNGLSQNTAADLTINNSAGVTLSAATNLSANLLISQGTLSASGSNFALSVGGNWTNNGGFTAGTSTQTFTGAAKTIGGTSSTTFGNMVIASGATYTMNTSNTASSLSFTAATAASSLTHATGTTFTVNGTVTLNQPGGNNVASSWNINTITATVSGLISYAGTGSTTNSRVQEIVITSGTLNANGGITFANVNNTGRRIVMSGGAGNLNLKGALTLAGQQTLTPGANSTFTYLDTTAAQTVNYFTAGSYNNLRLDNTSSGGATLSAAMTATNVIGNVLVGSINTGSILNNGGFAMTLASTENFSVGAGSTFNLTGTSTMITVSGGGTKTFNATSTTNYAGGNQTVTGETYGNLTISGTATKTAGAGVTVAGNFTISAATFAAATFTHNIAGNFTNNATLTQATSTFLFNGTSAQVIGGTTGTTFNNLTIDTNPATVTVTNSAIAFDVVGNLNVLDGNLVLQATDDNYTVTGNLTVASPSTLTHNVSWDAVSKQLNVGGNVAIDGIYTTGTAPRAHLSMTGSAKTIHSGTSAFNILTISSAGTITADGTVTVNDNFWAPFNTTGTFVTGANIINANASLLVSGGTLNANGGTLNVVGGLVIGQAAAAGGTVNISGSAVTTDGITLGHATGTNASTITHTGGSLTVNGGVVINQPTLAASNSWNINASTVTVSGLITFAGTDATATKIGRIAITTGTLNANGGITFVGSAAATKVIDMSGGAGNLNLRGALTVPAVSSTLIPGTSSIFSYVDAGTQTINKFTTGNYYNLGISGAGVKTFAAQNAIGNNLSIATGSSANLGTFAHTANRLTMGGFGTASGTHGSTTSAASNTNDTFFAATTGTVNISTSTCGAITAVLSGANTICNGSSTNLSVAVTGGLSNYTVVSSAGTVNNYASGTPVSVSPTTTTTYSLTSVKDSNGCLATVSGTPTVTVNPNLPASVSVAASPSTTICAGTNVTFTATPTNGGTLSYQWRLNGSNVGTNSPTYTNNTLANGNTVSVIMTSTATCATGSPATSNTVTMTVNPNLPASVSVAASPSTTICAGTNVTFTATPTNGGTPSYQWRLNGSNVGTNSATYTNNTLANGNTVSVIMTSTATCATGSPATSNTVTMTVNSASTAAVLSGSGSVCLGSPATLQVAITGGVSPYTVVYSNGASNTTVTSYVSGSAISVSPSATTTYTLVSVTSSAGCTGTGNSGSATVSIDSTTSTNGGVSWSNGVPSAGKSVIFDGSTGTIGADFAACSLRLINNAVVTVSSGFNVTLNGKLTVDTGSTFTLNNNSNLLQNTTIANSGNIIVKRNSAAIKRLDYTLWSSPVTGQELYAFSPLTFANRFYTYNPSSNNYVAYSGFNITGLNSDGVNGTDTAHAQFASATGYLIRTPWNHPTAPAVFAGTFTGVPNNGTIPQATTSGLYYAVGNPYPSTIDANTFISNNNIGNNPVTPGDGLYFWRKTNNASQTTNPSSSYATYTTAGGVKSGGDSLNIVPNGVIQVGEGFIVKATSTSLEFNNGQRIANNADQFLRNENIERHRIWLNLSDSVSNVNQMMVSYMTGATQGIDAAIDGRFFGDTPTALNSIVNNEEFAVQGRSLPFEATDVVGLAFKAANSGNYSIAIDHVDGLFTGGAQAIYLKDNQSGTYHNLNTSAYSFASVAGSFNGRFEIVYQSVLSNPVFTANTVVIYSQNDGFVVNSGNSIMASIKVFDIRGRLVEEQQGINATQATIKGGLANQVLLVQITSEEGAVVTKKVIK